MQQGEWAAASGPSRKTHRRSRSEGTGGALQEAASLGGFDLQGAGHMRTISLDTSASNFLQSLQLHDVSALQGSMLDAAEAAALDQQYDAAAIAAGAARPYAAASSKFAAAAAGEHAWQQSEAAVASAGSKRAHSGNGRVGKDGLQDSKKESLHQHKHSFTPALPAVEEAEDAAGPSDRDDEDYRESDSDPECYEAAPRQRRSSASGRGRARKGGYNGRSENELMLLDPKRVKRIMANRQSAARSKERRINHTMQLESKLQSIHSEVDRLNAQLEGMQGQGKLLLQARTELEQQLESMQQQLSQATADNQVLVSELFALQSALGLLQALPQPDMAAAAAAAAAAGQPLDVQQHGAQHGWRHDGGYSLQAVPGSSIAGDGCSSAAAADAGTAAGYGAGSGRLAAAAAAAGGMPPLPRHHARSPNLQSAAAAAAGQQQQGQQVAGRQQQQQQGGLPGAGNRPSSPRIPSPSPAAAAVAAGNTAAAAAVPLDSSTGVSAAAPVGAANSAAAAAADMLLLDQLDGDAAMTNADELDMLAALLDDSPIDPATAAAAAAMPVDQPPAAAGPGMPQNPRQQQQPFPVPLDPAAAAAMPQPLPAGIGSAQGMSAAQAAAGMHAAAHAPASTASYGSQQQPDQFDVQKATAQRPPPQHLGSKAGAAAGVAGWSLQSPPGSNATAAGFGAGLGGYGRTSPAFSDPLGAEGYHDDVSSGSLGGSLTPSTRLARVSDGRSIAAAGSGSQRVPPPMWQQQQQQHVVLPHVADGGSAAGAAAGAAVVGGAWGTSSPRTPSALQQMGGNAAAAAAQGGIGAAGGAGNAWQPISPAEAAAMEQQQQQQLGYTAAGHAYAGAAGSTAAAAGSALQQLPGPDHVNFVMGANPRQRFSAGKHSRSASAGSASCLGWTDGDRNWAQQLYSSGPLQQQQQQQQHNAHHAFGRDAAAAAGSSHMAGRASAPSGAGVLAAFDMHGPAPYRSNSSEGMAAMQHQNQQQQQQQQHQAGMRQPHHRRSCSYAGAGGGSYSYSGVPGQHWPAAGNAAAAAGIGMPNSSSCGELSMHLHQHHHQQQPPHQQQLPPPQQFQGIHPAALGPGVGAGLPDVGMQQQFAGVGRAGTPAGADVHALVMPTRIVTTGAAADGGPGMQQQQQQQRHHYM